MSQLSRIVSCLLIVGGWGVSTTFVLADLLDPGQRVDLHEGIRDADDVHHVHHTLTHVRRDKLSAAMTSIPSFSSFEPCLTVWTACHSPTSFLKSKTFTIVSAAGRQTGASHQLSHACVCVRVCITFGVGAGLCEGLAVCEHGCPGHRHTQDAAVLAGFILDP